MNIMLLFSGLVLVNKEIDKTPLENITGVKVVEQYKIIPQEVVAKDAITIQKFKTSKNVKKSKKKVKKTVKKKVKKVQRKRKVVKKTKKNSVRKNVKIPKRVRYNVGEIQSYAHQLVIEYGWSEEDYQALVSLWYRESSWNPNAVNKKSGACGIPQSLPCRKMASEGADYRTNYRTQVRWGLKYIKARYGSPSGAWSHSQQKGWY